MIVLHHTAQSRSMRVHWLLIELGVRFEVRQQPFDKSLRSVAFLAHSPAGRVPALELDGKPLFESGAIIQVLCARYPGAGLGRATDHAEWADWLIWLHFAETITQHVASLTQQHVILFEDEMRSPIVMKIEARRLIKCYDAIEAHLQRDDASDYLLAGGFSAADVAVAQAVYMAKHFARTDAHPRLEAWFNRCADRSAYRASLPKPGEARLYSRDFYEAWDV